MNDSNFLDDGKPKAIDGSYMVTHSYAEPSEEPEYRHEEDDDTGLVDGRVWLLLGIAIIAILCLAMFVWAWEFGGAKQRFLCAAMGGELLWPAEITARPICAIP